MSSLNLKKEDCHVCSKTVYPQERLSADSRIYHKACFRCKVCAGILKLGSYASMDGEVFCKVCFKKLFFTKGNYSEGFGKLKPQEQHDMKTGNKPIAVNLSVFPTVGKKNHINQNRTYTEESVMRLSLPAGDLDIGGQIDPEEQKRIDEEKKQARKLDILNLEANRQKQAEMEKKNKEEKLKQTVSTIQNRRTMMITPMDMQSEREKFHKEREEVIKAERKREFEKMEQEKKNAPPDQTVNNSEKEREEAAKARKKELELIEQQRKNAANDENMRNSNTESEEEIKLKKEKEREILEEKRKAYAEQKRLEEEKELENAHKLKDETAESKKQREEERIQREKDATKKREEEEHYRVMKERKERKAKEDEEMRQDEIRRQKILEETTFEPKSDKKFAKPTPPSRNKKVSNANDAN